MHHILNIIFIFFFFELSKCEDSCWIDIKCDDCHPEHIPYISSHNAVNGEINILHGEEVNFHCHRSKFKLYPELNNIYAFCENGVFKMKHDSKVFHHSELGCLGSYLEDVSHFVENCNSSFQGRSFQYYNTLLYTVHHVAEICYDQDKGRTIFGHMTFADKNDIIRKQHIDKYDKINILESFAMMTDNLHKTEAEKIYINDEVMFKRIKSLLGIRHFNFADHSLIITKLLPTKYFYEQNTMVTKFPSNKIVMWKNIVNGNMKHIQDDIFKSFSKIDSNYPDDIDIYVGTHDVLSVSINNKPHEIYISPGNKYPVPEYVYTLVHNKKQKKGVALILINNPFISVSEIRNAVFCPSICHLINWITNLKLSNNYERSAYGIVFCCDVHSFSNIVSDGPNILNDIHIGERGILKHIIN